MRNPNQAGNEEQTGAVDPNPSTAPHDTRGPRTRRSGLASRLGPRGARPSPGEVPWAQEVADAVLAATPADDPAPGSPAALPAPADADPEDAEPEDAEPEDAEPADAEPEEEFATSFFWSSATADGPARPWRSLFR
ncbi:hypothetical protein [Pseudofrankia inefficax]|uniref:Uncharacterized protein n=1 Tax=Pseudofrankia inefficax (strain DSM 45817 / CECT 9037 / DDB 130130 / EuI1c) TaxID=298654 RepID=E3J712_PSEI1|nr:hypothetical protein [Pseudofrankia inefficax]ADP83232.1 hypothetical protein FraEuI1c_5244 [Pseudofrankia inefficax]